MKNYIIDENTYAVIPTYNGCKVITKNNSYFIDITAKNIINNSCRYYGSSLDGRISGSRCILGIFYKTPIMISESKNIIMFPTSSIRNIDCIWINITSIKEYKKSDNNTILLTFHNNIDIKLDISYRVLDKQILRSSRLESLFLCRK